MPHAHPYPGARPDGHTGFHAAITDPRTGCYDRARKAASSNAVALARKAWQRFKLPG